MKTAAATATLAEAKTCRPLERNSRRIGISHLSRSLGLLLSLGTIVGELLLFAPILLVREAKISVVKNSQYNGEVFEEALLVRRRRRSRGGRGISRIQVHLKVIKSLNYLILSISLPVWQYVEFRSN